MKNCFSNRCKYALLMVSVALLSAGCNDDNSPRIKGDICAVDEPTIQKQRGDAARYLDTYKCQKLGVVTIAQIYDKGWRVVAFMSSANNLIIEEQR